MRGWALGMGLLALVLLVGAAVPLAWMDDGVAELPPEMQEGGRLALTFAAIGCLEPGDRVVTLRLRVLRVDSTEGRFATVQAHTLFGIPLNTITIFGGSVSCRS